MTAQYIINFEHVELMKVTSDTTVYVRFASGAGEVIEFKNVDKLNDIVKAFFDWGYDGKPSKVCFIDKEMK